MSLTAVDKAFTLPNSEPLAPSVQATSTGVMDISLVSSTIPPNTPNPSAYISLDPSTVPALPYPTTTAYLPLDSTTSTAIPSAYLPLDSTTQAANPSAYLPLNPSNTAGYVRISTRPGAFD